MKTILFFGLLALTACGTAVEKFSNLSPDQGQKACCVPLDKSEGVAAPTEMSLYNLSSTWATPQGDSVNLSHLRGKIQLVAMVYTNCQTACPRIVADLKQIQAAIPRKENVGFVLVSLDPDRDTPEKLRSFATSYQLDQDRWQLLTGKEGDVQDLAVLLGLKFKKLGQGEISHANLISVLNAEGEIVYQEEELGVDKSKIIARIQQLITKSI